MAQATLIPLIFAVARRWVQAINRDGRFGRWVYEVVYHPTEALKVGNYAARRAA
jgi:hypothetical protein